MLSKKLLIKSQPILFTIFLTAASDDIPTVQVTLPGLLGNRLFAFCIGKIIAEELAFKLSCKSIWGFPNTYSYAYNTLSKAYRTQEIKGHLDLDIAKIIKDKSKRNIKISGYFQRYQYLRPYAEKIRQDWLAIDPSLTYTQDPDDVILHVRTHHPNVFLPFEYYQQALSSITYKRLFICTDEPKDPFLDNFKCYNPIIHSSRSLSQYMNAHVSWDIIAKMNIDDFMFIRSFNKIILSQSTYAWWAAFLSDATEIFAPYSNTEKQIYGKVDEPRYHYINTTIGRQST